MVSSFPKCPEMTSKNMKKMFLKNCDYMVGTEIEHWWNEDDLNCLAKLPKIPLSAANLLLTRVSLAALLSSLNRLCPYLFFLIGHDTLAFVFLLCFHFTIQSPVFSFLTRMQMDSKYCKQYIWADLPFRYTTRSIDLHVPINIWTLSTVCRITRRWHSTRSLNSWRRYEAKHPDMERKRQGTVSMKQALNCT